ncbi:MAG: hypothetical protein ABI175_13275 [Polyangiales bacterium]
MTASRVLDQVQSLAHAEALAPGDYATRLAAELAPVETREDIAARDEVLREAFTRIEATAARIMRIRLDHLLADDTAIAVPTRKVFAQTVADYAGRLDVLETRAREIAARGGARDPGELADRVVRAAEATLVQRAELYGSVLELAGRLAKADAPMADAKARDRREAEPPRRLWSAVRRELEAIAARPERVLEAAFAIRLAGWESLLDDPDPENEPTLADLIELD